ncbi:alpha/beta fold hydrolase [candidate division KSB1 bacterium]|nr:alpha/beta fold hydrolase [candidate division KSB1 bacterium]
MSKTQEEMFFFKGSRVDLMGFVHIPKDMMRTSAIVYCHPFAEEKNCCHSVTVKAARAFARQGFAVFRFDFNGCGDSQGEFNSSSLHNWLDDISAAISEAKRRTRVENIMLWGVRLGAALAMVYAQHHEDIAALVLWQPVFHFKDYIQQFVRQKLVSDFSHERQSSSLQTLLQKITAGETVHVNGYPLSNPLYGSFLAMDHDHPQLTTRHLVYISTISNMPAASAHLVQKIDQLRQKCPSFSYVHTVEEPFWDRYWRWDARRTIENTQAWLASQGG